jgi:hypothetical protein
LGGCRSPVTITNAEWARQGDLEGTMSGQAPILLTRCYVLAPSKAWHDTFGFGCTQKIYTRFVLGASPASHTTAPRRDTLQSQTSRSFIGWFCVLNEKGTRRAAKGAARAGRSSSQISHSLPFILVPSLQGEVIWSSRTLRFSGESSSVPCSPLEIVV